MKILLVGIYDTNTVSLAPQILKAYAQQFPIAAAYQIETIEFSIFSDSREFMAANIAARQPEIIGFSCYIWNFKEITSLIPELKGKIILGGPQVTDLENELLAQYPQIDFIVTGEGERTFVDLLEYYQGQRQLTDLSGVTGLGHHSPPACPTDLSSIPRFYAQIFQDHPGLGWISFETSRGCPNRCSYCTWGYSPRMRYFPLERVLADLDLILESSTIKTIYLCDSSLLFNKKRAKTILKHIIAHGSTQTIRYEFSAEQLDEELIELMSQLTGDEVNFGIQTVNPLALANVGRKFDRATFETNFTAFVEKSPRATITIDLIYGLPGDDIEGYKNSLEYAMHLPRVSRIMTNPLIVLPGSGLFRRQKELGIKFDRQDSFILEENQTFSSHDMLLAKKYSFYVEVTYLNLVLKQVLQKMAEISKRPTMDLIIEFFETLPFPLIASASPFMIPSVKADFNKRNLAMREVVEGFANLMEALRIFSNHEFDRRIDHYLEQFTPQFYKYKKFAGLT